MKDSYESQIIALVLILISPYLLISAMLEASIWISSKSWHGRLVATVKEIKRVWHFRACLKNEMIPGSKGLKSDAGLPARGFLNLGPAKNMKKQPDQGGF